MNRHNPLPKVLVVDDDPFNLRAIKLMFREVSRRIGYNVHQNTKYVSTGNDAVKELMFLFMDRERSHDLVIVDLSMPEIDGFKVC